VRAIELATPAEEAQTIALALREALETPGRTAALITPDRGLARRVAAHLKRWDVAIDDSAGRPLSATAAGTLLAGIAEAAIQGFAPVALLALLKHPLVRRGEGRIDWLDGVRALDRMLRGPRPVAGLEGIDRHLAGDERRLREIREAAAAWWAPVRALLAPLEASFAARGAGLAELLGAIRSAAEALAGDEAWAGPDGREAARLLEALEAAAGEGPGEIAPRDIAALLGQAMAEVAVRPPQGGHPRLAIYGLLEARLQQADLVVLGGLNEGVWPGLPSPDPWLAPPIRRALGLPGLETRIGYAAHDFASALGAPQVIVTRARRDARAPTIASRFWLRLEALTGGMRRDGEKVLIARRLDAAAYAPARRPEPAPPAATRPREIAVTEVDRLQADPYAFYARAVLRLSAWDAVDAEPSPAWRGTLVHGALEQWLRQDGCAPDRLEARIAAMLADTATHPLMRTLWTPRLAEAVRWIGEEMTANIAAGRIPIEAEIFGETEIAGVTLYGKVDRIDRLADGGLAIVDYKTGKAPSPKEVGAGYAMQLGLLGLIAENGGFPNVTGTPSTFEYWSLARGSRGGFGHVSSPVAAGRDDRIPPEDFTRRSAGIFAAAAGRWLTGDESFTAKLHPERAPYDDYDQLMRLDEWYGRGNGGD
jgi:ATP-dependent helicase/nuclease subunit B